MEIPIYQVDAFADELFRGNPAAVCPLDAWLDDGELQAIAAENNLSETAFFLPATDPMPLRWFTPAVEVPLCGHATLATAHVVWHELGRDADVLRFESRQRGELAVRRVDHGRLQLDFPAYSVVEASDREALLRALGCAAEDVVAGDKLSLVRLPDEDAVRAVAPDMRALAAHERFVIVTAPGREVDFVSRFFAPAAGIDEDPVTGSAHCLLTPYWAARLRKTELSARQISARGGQLWCELHGERVRIAGHAVTYLRGTLSL